MQILCIVLKKWLNIRFIWKILFFNCEVHFFQGECTGLVCHIIYKKSILNQNIWNKVDVVLQEFYFNWMGIMKVEIIIIFEISCIFHSIAKYKEYLMC